jgi:restriction system protein
MSVPDYQSLMLPLLRVVGDGKVHLVSDLIEKLADEFKLSDSDRAELLNSGYERRFDNRVWWARTWLKKAEFIESPERGKVQISKRGIEFLRQKPKSLRAKDLRQLPGFREVSKSKEETEGISGSEKPATETPLESIERSVATIKDNLAVELLDRIKQSTPKFFERLVVDLLVAIGYGGSRKDAGAAIGRSGDGGIDGTVKQDALGLDIIYVQAKRWEANVGRPEVQGFVGSLEGMRAQRGIMITTSAFSKEAHKYVEQIGKKIILIDGPALTELMIEHGVGVSTVQTYSVKKIDNDFFTEE